MLPLPFSSPERIMFRIWDNLVYCYYPTLIVILSFQSYSVHLRLFPLYQSFERYEGESIKKKYPQFAATPQWTCLYQKDAGLVDAAMGNSVHIQLARKNGATIIDDAAVIKIVKQGNLTKVFSLQC